MALSPGAVDLVRLTARLGGAMLVLVLALSLLPASIVPNGVPLVLAIVCVSGVLFTGLMARSFRFDAVTPVSFALVAIGLIYVGASMLEILPVGNQRPVRHDFILRHAYYVFVWLPLMAGTAVLFREIWASLLAVARRAALPALFFLAAGDLVTAIVLGDPEKIVWEEYTSFFDPSAITFLYAACFLFHVATTRRIWIALGIATAHALISKFSDYGMMFNTMTGAFVLAIFWAFALAGRRSPLLALAGALALGACLLFGLAAGAAGPDLLGFDLNTQWRFLVWRENLFGSLESGLLGVGYGTPYYQLSPGNISEAFRLTHFAEFTQYAYASPLDILYIRGQHSSFVNAIYRTGILGGAALIAFNVAVALVVWRAVRKRIDIDMLPVAAAGALFVVEASQIAMHVGIESPRYFTMYALAAGLARAAASQAGTRRHA